MLFFFLNLNPHPGKTLRQHVAELDFVGLLLITAGILCVLFAFNESENGCEKYRVIDIPFMTDSGFPGNQVSTIVLLVVGVVTLIAAGVNEYFTSRSPIVPPRLFRVSKIRQNYEELAAYKRID
jgi:hypothetical protein